MFMKYLGFSLRRGNGLVRARNPRNTKPSLERLDTRIAPSGSFNRVIVALPLPPLPVAESRPFVTTVPAMDTSSLSGVRVEGHGGAPHLHAIPFCGTGFGR
jgi:hypothetical protein